MSRIAELRASLSSPATGTGLSVSLTRMEWAEFVREYRCNRLWYYPSVREIQQHERALESAMMCGW
jgi:hypothetical protein